MGIKIDLPIHSLEEANVLDAVLLLAAKQKESLAKLRHTTDEEAFALEAERTILLGLRARLLGSD
jgi:hypothetical protein